MSSRTTADKSDRKSWMPFFVEVGMHLAGVAGLGASIYLMHKAWNMDVDNTKEDRSLKKKLLAINGRPAQLITNSYENRILPDVLLPDQIRVSFHDIGGLKALQEQVIETVILPLRNPEFF